MELYTQRKCLFELLIEYKVSMIRNTQKKVRSDVWPIQSKRNHSSIFADLKNQKYT